MLLSACLLVFFFFKQKTAYEIVSRDWSSDVCSSDLLTVREDGGTGSSGTDPDAPARKPGPRRSADRRAQLPRSWDASRSASGFDILSNLPPAREDGDGRGRA